MRCEGFNEMTELLNAAECGETLLCEEYESLINAALVDEEMFMEIKNRASKIRHDGFSNKVYVRGLIEYSNYCRCDCYYCGIRKSNNNINRYRLSRKEIEACAKSGYDIGFRTFVLQSGEDEGYGDDKLCDIIKSLKEKYPECAITLSVGERDKETYKRWKDAGADRFLLRHETADKDHFSHLHPPTQTFDSRKQCLYNLKELGYQTGAGMMIGSPGQSIKTLAKDLVFLKELNPQMVGIGPFISQKDTPFRGEKNGDVRLTLIMLSLVRIILPDALLPATSALASMGGDSRNQGIVHGANVIMPNLSPQHTRKDYALYDDKLSSGLEAAENLNSLKNELKKIGYEIDMGRGDYEGRLNCV